MIDNFVLVTGVHLKEDGSNEAHIEPTVTGPFTRDQAFAEQTVAERVYREAREKYGDKAFPYGEPYAYVELVQDKTAERSATNWVYDPELHEEKQVILQVVMQSMNPGQANALERRFGKFFSREEARVEYPVSCDSHGEDVFRDEFGEGTVHEGKVNMASLLEVYLTDGEFVPFNEEGDTGMELYEIFPG